MTPGRRWLQLSASAHINKGQGADQKYRGILVPGGFGQRGTEGMVLAAKRARENKIPYLGICLGFQIAIVEYARNVCDLEGKRILDYIMYPHSMMISGAISTEFEETTEHPVIIYMPEISKTHMGGTMRLGLRPTVFLPGSEDWSIARKLYGGREKIWERHRHRYEVNPQYIDQFRTGGQLEFVGRDEKGERMQVLELRGMSLLEVNPQTP